jgi:hypothetical protein
MQVSYNRLENPSKNLWCNRHAKRDSQKLVNLVVPDKSEKFSGSQRDSVDTRVLFSSLLGSHENRGNETCDRSLYSEQLPFGSPFQNGDQQIYQSLYSSRYVKKSDQQASMTRKNFWIEFLQKRIVQIRMSLNRQSMQVSRCGSSRSPSHSTSPVLSSGTLGLRVSRLGGSSTYSFISSKLMCYCCWTRDHTPDTDFPSRKAPHPWRLESVYRVREGTGWKI